MRADGHEYRGFLYAGLMITCDGPRVIEFNVRFGDPEAQVVIPMIEDDLAPHLAAAADGRLLPDPVDFSADKHVGVVLASRGLSWAGDCRSCGSKAGRTRRASSDVLVFHSGTALAGFGRRRLQPACHRGRARAHRRRRRAHLRNRHCTRIWGGLARFRSKACSIGAT